MDSSICCNTGISRAFSCCPPSSTGTLLHTGGGMSFHEALRAAPTAASKPAETVGNVPDGLNLLRALAGISSATEPEVFANSDAYAKHLTEKFSVRVTVKAFGKDQESLDALGRNMSGNDVVIAPNILDEMATNRDKARYYEQKIQYYFDHIPQWKTECAAMGLTYEPCGVAIHEDGTVYYIGGGTETPERKAKIAAAQKAKREKKLRHWQEQQAYSRKLIQQKQIMASAIAAEISVITTDTRLS